MAVARTINHARTVCLGGGAIAFGAKYVLYKNAKPTELCSAVDIRAVNVRKVGAGVGSQTPLFFLAGKVALWPYH